MVKVVLDAMGGDHAPDAALDGAALAIEKGFIVAEELVLVGQTDVLKARLNEVGQADLGMEIVEAPEVVGCDEGPVEAIRRKPNSSIAVGLGLVKSGAAGGFVSAGSTGVVAATASLGLGTLEGIRRPGIAAIIHGEHGPFMIVDVGANPQPKPLHLLQYGLMGSAYFQHAIGTVEPRVALMNIGSEAAKGNALTREVAELLSQAPVNFVGNIEGVQLFRGDCDVVVCDGFTGNVILKVSEGLVEYLMRLVTNSLAEVDVDTAHIESLLAKVTPRIDYSAYGGALLLGAKGVVTICHGRSGAAAFANALKFAKHAIETRVNDQIVAMVREAASPS